MTLQQKEVPKVGLPILLISFYLVETVFILSNMEMDSTMMTNKDW